MCTSDRDTGRREIVTCIVWDEEEGMLEQRKSNGNTYMKSIDGFEEGVYRAESRQFCELCKISSHLGITPLLARAVVRQGHLIPFAWRDLVSF